ncbi:hypothetical protein D3C86_1283360 [compost metagenome]
MIRLTLLQNHRRSNIVSYYRLIPLRRDSLLNEYSAKNLGLLRVEDLADALGGVLRISVQAGNDLFRSLAGTRRLAFGVGDRYRTVRIALRVVPAGLPLISHCCCRVSVAIAVATAVVDVDVDVDEPMINLLG